MKRKINSSTVYQHTRSKKPRLQEPIVTNKPNKLMVSATHIHNFMIKDTLVDWLKTRRRRGTRSTPVYTKNLGFTEFIKSKGIEFEDKLIKYWKNNNNIPIISVGYTITPELCKKAIRLMKEGHPILHSVPVINNYTKTRGIIDLLVRSDYIENLIKVNPLLPHEIDTPAPKLGLRNHYFVIDIKFSTIPLRKDGIHILNSKHFRAYKAQTLIYTQAIGRIQGFTPPYSFILGRKWTCTKNKILYRGNSCLDRLGRIDFAEKDKWCIKETRKAIKWVRNVKENGFKWAVDPPSRIELYPNMCVDSGKWNKEKLKIAEKIGEITSVWNVGVKHRSKALLQDIRSWRNKLCTTKTLGIGGKRAVVIDKIIQINRQDKIKLLPEKIKSNIHNWKKIENEVFVDFETLSNIFDNFGQLPKQNDTNLIFMIGVGWVEKGDWEYKNFICKSPTTEEEYRIMNEFYEFMESRGFPKAYYWHAEQRIWDRSENKHFESTDDVDKQNHISDNWLEIQFYDLFKLFREEPIVIKGCFKFGLKAIAKAMYSHKMVKSKIISNCNSGMNAMIRAWEFYRNPSNTHLMKDIGVYNEFDCKIIWEIVTYLRNNHL